MGDGLRPANWLRTYGPQRWSGEGGTDRGKAADRWRRPAGTVDAEAIKVE